MERNLTGSGIKILDERGGALLGGFFSESAVGKKHAGAPA
jgi:hypothetical protein